MKKEEIFDYKTESGRIVQVKKSLLISLGLMKCPHGHLYPQLGGENRCKLCNKSTGRKNPSSHFPKKPKGVQPPWEPRIGKRVRPPRDWKKMIQEPCEPEWIHFKTKWGDSPSFKKCKELCSCKFYDEPNNKCLNENQKVGSMDSM